VLPSEAPALRIDARCPGGFEAFAVNHFLHGVARATAEAFNLPEPILEIGALQVEGQESVADLRPFFAGKKYQGVDFRPGPGVDLVANVEALPQPTASIGTVIAMSTFEHVQRFWRGLDEVSRVLRPDGALLIACPFYFHIHSYPSDYWRFTPMALDFLLERYPTRLIGRQGPTRRPANVWALAFRERAPAVSETQYHRYQELIQRYAHEPLGWRRRVRYRIGRWLCGSRPFAPYLERSSWQIDWRKAS
jgi:SAM-dependent methyltransferase